MRNFSNRSIEKEIMDESDVSYSELSHCLKSLEIINILTMAYSPTLNWVQQIIARSSLPLIILDAASGGGDMARRIYNLDKRNTVFAVDLNSLSKQYAIAAYPNSGVIYKTVNIFEFKPEKPIDIIVSSLFTHHLNDLQIVDFLKWINKTAAKGWFINDLHRHWLPYYFIKIATRLFNRNRLIRNDAAVSVARSFTKSDWERLLRQAGLEGKAKINWYFPFRICVSSKKI